jgi:Flp pilus assembly protein TadD
MGDGGGGADEAVMTCCSYHSLRPLASVAFLVLLALSTTACNITQSKEATGTLAISSAPPRDTNWRRSAENWGDRFRANPGDPEAAINYAQALRGIRQRSQAAAVLKQASIRNPKHKGVRGAYGRALADTGNYQQALDELNHAHTSDQPDWRILSVQGAMLDQMGRHDEAQRYYATALRIAPDEPSILSNLGLSYALSKDLVRAESTLRRATAHGRADKGVQQNLAVVVGLQGRHAEAKTIALADLPSEGAANVTYLRQMLAQQNGWESQGS